MHLFFYGVLRDGLGSWPFLKGIGPGRPAVIRGSLFGLQGETGWYPALVAGENEVVGAVHEAGGADIAAMDAFEGPDYERAPVRVETSGTITEAHAYRWIASLPPGAERIAHGDFAHWLEETGRSPITG